MPSHLTPSEPPPDISPESELATEMPPPLFSSIQEQLPRSTIDDIGVMIIVATVIVAGILVFIVLRRRKK